MRGRRFTDKDIEELLSGGAPDDAELARLAPLARALRRAGERIPPEAKVARVAAQAAEIAKAAGENAPTGARRAHDARRGRAARLSPKLAAAAVLIAAVLSTTGVAVAANGAAPGDTLYGFDRALESIGLGAGGLEERLAEAMALADNGAVMGGLEHAAEAIAAAGQNVSGAEDANKALAAAANVLTAANAGEIDQVNEHVREMLRWIAASDPRGSGFGQALSAIAQGIQSDTGSQPATSTTIPGGSPPDPQGGEPGPAGGGHSGPTTTTQTGAGPTGQTGNSPTSQTQHSNGGTQAGATSTTGHQDSGPGTDTAPTSANHPETTHGTQPDGASNGQGPSPGRP